MSFSIKEIVKNNTVNFDRYMNGFCHYKVMYDNEVYEFPVPISDVGNGTLNEYDKAIYYMRYIRKAIQNDEFVPLNDISIAKGSVLGDDQLVRFLFYRAGHLSYEIINQECDKLVDFSFDVKLVENNEPVYSIASEEEMAFFIEKSKENESYIEYE